MFSGANLTGVALATWLMVGCTAPPTTTAGPAAAPVNAVEARPSIEAPYQGEVPDYAKKSPETEAAYRWAATNRSILQYFQCTCGCDRTSGHKSNWNCYVKEEKPGGEYVWDPMSAG